MAGGMNRQGSGIPLGERRRAGAATGPVVGAEPVEDTCPVRHCWVADAVDLRGVKRPGLLVEWRRTTVSWEGRVVYAVTLRPGEWALVEEWLPADQLTQR
ncbi:hypothetical protein H5V45_19665 [Nocardioides sp. KIGAM211]|uniref:Uncharacterized protein n=2 Tax=Nocardioides luti TaxID=2761101 RepID=A0A7X0VDP1_9ACTN|nr:hypothetical protein [Nocardioides luti]